MNLSGMNDYSINPNSPFTHSRTHRFTHSPIHTLTYSHTHTLTIHQLPPAYSLQLTAYSSPSPRNRNAKDTHSRTHKFTHSPIHLFTHSPIHQLPPASSLQLSQHRRYRNFIASNERSERKAEKLNVSSTNQADTSTKCELCAAKICDFRARSANWP